MSQDLTLLIIGFAGLAILSAGSVLLIAKGREAKARSLALCLWVLGAVAVLATFRNLPCCSSEEREIPLLYFDADAQSSWQYERSDTDETGFARHIFSNSDKEKCSRTIGIGFMQELPFGEGFFEEYWSRHRSKETPVSRVYVDYNGRGMLGAATGFPGGIKTLQLPIPLEATNYDIWVTLLSCDESIDADVKALGNILDQMEVRPHG